MKKMIMGVIAVFLVGGTSLLYMLSNTNIFEASTERSSETALLQEQLVELSELATLKYEYSNVIVSRTNKSVSLLGMTDIEFAEAIKLIAYSGYLKAGTDLSDLQYTADEETKKASVRVPHSQILDNVVDTDKTTVEDIKGNIFSDYPTQIVFDEINANKKEVEEEKINEGFLVEADKQVETLLIAIFNSNGYTDVDIEFH